MNKNAAGSRSPPTHKSLITISRRTVHYICHYLLHAMSCSDKGKNGYVCACIECSQVEGVWSDGKCAPNTTGKRVKIAIKDHIVAKWTERRQGLDWSIIRDKDKYHNLPT